MSKYPSRYSNGKMVTAAQYITELICEKKARKDGGDLPQEFWKQDKWASYFRQQIVSANGLLRIYDAQAIIRALKSNASFSIFSLRAPHLDDIIKKEQAALEVQEMKQAASTIEIKRVDVTSKPRQSQKSVNVLSKLKQLDEEGANGEEKEGSR